MVTSSFTLPVRGSWAAETTFCTSGFRHPTSHSHPSLLSPYSVGSFTPSSVLAASQQQRPSGDLIGTTMTTSRRLAGRKIAKFEKNITKRGAVAETTVKKGNDYPVGPIVLGFFVFVVIGSSLFQIIRTATSRGFF